MAADLAAWARAARVEAESRAREIFEGGLHFVFVVRVGPRVVPQMRGTVDGVGNGDGLLHIDGQAEEVGEDGRAIA